MLPADISKANINSYGYIKSLAEEAEGWLEEGEVPIVSHTRPLVLVMVALTLTLLTLQSPLVSLLLLILFALISTEELEQLGQIMVKAIEE